MYIIICAHNIDEAGQKWYDIITNMFWGEI